MNSNESSSPIDPQVRIGHVHLKVADLERSLGFYCGVLGFELTQRYGTQAAFVSAGATTITLPSIPGRAWADRRRLRERRGFTTSPSCIRPAMRWPTPSSGSSAQAFRSMEPAIMALAKRYTCVTRTRTEWNCIGIGHRMLGLGRRRVNWRWSLDAWT